MSEAAIHVPAGSWTADPGHSRVGFAVKHLGIATVRGHFGEFSGSLEIGDDLSSAKILGSVKTASVDTNEADRDAHLRSPEFFESDAHPEMTFESTSVTVKDEDSFLVKGNLTIRGVTNEVELEAEIEGTETDPWGNARVGLEIEGSLSRGDFGMKFNQALGSGNVLVGDKVKLHLDVSAVKQD